MTNEQILEKQVEALEKLLQLRSAIIEELETKVTNLQQEIATKNAQIIWPSVTTPWTSVPGVTVPYNPPTIYPYSGGNSGSIVIGPSFCPDGTPHQYPSMWGGTNPPACSKCGNYRSAGLSGILGTLTGSAQINGTSGSGSNVSTNNVFTLQSIAK